MRRRIKRYLYADVPVPRRTEYRRRKKAEREALRRDSSSDEDADVNVAIARNNEVLPGFQDPNQGEFPEARDANDYWMSSSHELSPERSEESNDSHSDFSDRPMNPSDEDMREELQPNSNSSSESIHSEPQEEHAVTDIEELNEQIVPPHHDGDNQNFYQRQNEDQENNGEGVLLSDQLCPCTTTTEGDALLMCLSLGIRHNLSWKALVDILKMINKLFNKEVVSASKYYLLKYFEQGQDSTEYHMFCPQCEAYLGSKNYVKENEIMQCDCGEEVKAFGQSSSFFISVSLERQLKNLFETPGISEEILTYRFQRQKADPNAYEDIFDGEGYKSFFENGGPLSDPNNISVTINTDGLDLGSSSFQSAWPIFLFVNELSPKKRVKHILFGGIWVGKKQPNMRLFLRPFVQAMERLSLQGFNWKNSNGIEVNSKVFPLIAVLDSAARFKFLNLSSYTSYYGCTLCYHKAENTGKGRRFTIPENPAPLRTHDSMMRDMQRAHTNRNNVDKKKRIVKGCKGLSPLVYLSPYLNLGFGIVAEYMHNALQGVARSHAAFVLGTTRAPYYIGDHDNLHYMNERLLRIKPPKSITRTPRTLTEAKKWKASEWRSWLLFYSIVVFDGILKNTYIYHFAMLSSAFYILLQKSITKENLDVAEKYLLQFVYLTQQYFGKTAMLYNIHLLLHVCSGSRFWGPVWSHNAFVFEGENRYLKQMHTSPGRVPQQLCRRFLTFRSLPVLCSTYASTEAPIDYIQDIMGRKLLTYFRCGETVMLGKGFVYALNEDEVRCLYEADIYHNNEDDIMSFSRIIHRGVRYTTNCYANGKKNDDSWIRLSSGQRGTIRRILRVNTNDGFQTILFVQLVVCERNPLIKTNFVTLNHIKRIIEQRNTLTAVHVNDIINQCIYMDLDTGKFVSDIPYGCYGD